MMTYEQQNQMQAPLTDRRKHAIEAMYGTAHWLMTNERWADASDVFRAMAFFAPSDERSWLGLGTCHENLRQRFLALQMYGVGFAMARSVRCELARARTLRECGREDEADDALDRAAEAAEESDDDTLRALVAVERRAT